MGRIGFSLILAFLVCGGCAAGAPQAAGPTARWIISHGGRIDGPAAQRAARINLPFERLVHANLRVHVLASTQHAAWSFPSGDIFLTRALAEDLSDDEIAAVIAHEIGHLLHDGHARTNVVALTGLSARNKLVDAEAAADATAVHLLASAELPRTSMRRALQKTLAAQKANGATRRRLEQRIARLP